jgi:hypothetical protein
MEASAAWLPVYPQLCAQILGIGLRREKGPEGPLMCAGWYQLYRALHQLLLPQATFCEGFLLGRVRL